jgi:dienelactone hydrolase
MPVDAECPHCGRRYRVSSALAGKSVECEYCAYVFRVPALEPETIPGSARGPGAALAGARQPAPPPAHAVMPQYPQYAPRPRRPRQPLDLHNPYTYVIAGSVLTFLLLVLAFISSYSSTSSPHPVTQSARADADIADPMPSTDDLPELPAASYPAPGIFLHEVHLPTGGASRESMSLYLLLPDRPRSPLPCIFIAPAGTPCVTGNTLGPDEFPELFPYVQAGFAVCAYSLDGPLGVQPTSRQVIDAVDRFELAKAGLLNARRAMDFVTRRAPQISPDHFYAAGHSSAATLALLLAAREPRIKAVAAYCPCLDVLEHNREFFNQLERYRPGTINFARNNSPLTLARQMNAVPILLFGSHEDRVVDTSTYAPFQQTVQAAGGHVSLTFVPRGDHYNAMIRDGIPGGIAFFNTQLATSTPQFVQP